MKLSTILVVKDAEKIIVDCLESVDFSNEIVVVDSGSSDRTCEIAEKMEAKVFRLKEDDFSALRNYGLEKAKGEIIFYIDADERVDNELKQEIKKLQARESLEFSLFNIKRKNFYLGDHEWPRIETIERIFLKKDLKKWEGELHEHPVVSGKTGSLSGFLLHYTHRDLTSMLNKTIKWSEVEANLRIKANHPKMTWWRFPRVMISAFIDSYIIQGGYKSGTVGLIESTFQSFSMFITYARLWEFQNRAGSNNENSKK